MVEAPEDYAAFLATRPRNAFRANLFTFTLVSGPVYRFTDWRVPITIGGNQYLPGPPRLVRGQIKLSCGVEIDSTDIQLQEANGTFIAKLAQGYFNRALFLQQRVVAADQAFQWMGPITKFFGRVADITDIGRTSAKITVKSALYDLDNDFPRTVVMPSCDRVLYDAGCTVDASSYETALAAGAGSTRNKLLATITQAAPYYDQGYLMWTSGVMAGIAYMVKTTDSGAVYPAYPFLVAPSAGDTFNLFAGCDKSQDTCTSKFSNLANFTGKPFVPDPTLTY